MLQRELDSLRGTRAWERITCGCPPHTRCPLSTPFLQTFATAVVRQLLLDDKLEIRRGDEIRVADYVAQHLGQLEPGAQLVSSISDALIACPMVEELYADKRQLADLITGLGA